MIPRFVVYHIRRFYPHSCSIWPIHNEEAEKFGCALMRMEGAVFREALYEIPDVFDSEEEAVAEMSRQVDIAMQTLKVEMN